MTKPNTKLVALAVLLALSLPGTAWALPLLDIPDFKKDVVVPKFPVLPTPKAKNAEEFCADFSATSAELGASVKGRQDTLSERLDTAKSGRVEERDARDARLSEARTKADERRSEWYLRLEDKAKSDAEKDAVVDFKQTIEKAIEVRREAVDQALATFRTSVDALHEKRKSEMTTARDAFQTAVDVAVAKVKTDCDQGETTVVIKKNFRDALKTAREKLKNDKANVTKISAEVKTLATTKQKTLQGAFDVFQTALNQAKAALKSAFDTSS